MRRLWGTLFAAFLLILSAAGAFAQTAPIAPQQREAFRQLIREFLLENPEVLVEAMERLEERRRVQAAEQAQRTIAERRSEMFENPAHPVVGNASGDVTVVEFFDYRCPYCRQAHGVLVQLRREDPNIRFVHIQLPILGNDSVLAARAALAARRQEKYTALHNALMDARATLDQPAVSRIAGSVGVNVQQMIADMNRPEITQLIEANRALAEALGDLRRDRNRATAYAGRRSAAAVIDAAAITRRGCLPSPHPLPLCIGPDAGITRHDAGEGNYFYASASGCLVGSAFAKAGSFMQASNTRISRG
jgi:protein-disulfide isomerase